MSELRAAVADYLQLRLALGFTIRAARTVLPDFVDYLEQQGAAQPTTQLALAWATRPQGVQPLWWHRRLAMVRDFARYLHNLDPGIEVPPSDLLPGKGSRVTPYLYSDADIHALMAATTKLSPSLRAATYRTLIGLLVVTGVRIGEAISLDRADIDHRALLLTVRHAKGGAARRVPLHQTTSHALHRYAELRDTRFPDHPSPCLFVSIRGTQLCPSAVNETFRELVGRAGLEGRGQRCRPRIHDLRHSYAVNCLLGWHQQGADIDARLPLLSAVLGHVGPASTYWYLQASPELMAIVGQRLEHVLGELP